MSTPPPTSESLKTLLAPICATVATLNLQDTTAAQTHLETVHPPLRYAEALRDARDAGWLTPREATPTLRYGRLSKATPETHGCSIDVVDMEGPGAAHLHPNGEVSLCLDDGGDPRFCGQPAGWVVVPPGSRHTPEVSGGRMLIAYFLPGGAIDFLV